MRPITIALALFIFLINASQPILADAQPMARTVQEALKKVDVSFKDGYFDSRPRMLFTSGDLPKLKHKAQKDAENWELVISQAKRLGSHVPDSQTIRDGSNRGRYIRSEWILSGALAYQVTGVEAYRDDAIKWMVAHCKEDTWGIGYNPNVDLIAAWYLYYISLAYDILYDEIPAADMKIIKDGLIDHARLMYESKLPPQQYRFDQNHTFIPSTGLAAAALALYDEVDEAKDWLRIVKVLMDRSRWVLGTDGYYYEGYGYWAYAMNWHHRYADLMQQATGEDMFDLDIFRKNHLFALYTSLPGPPYGFDFGDGSKGALGRNTQKQLRWAHMLYLNAAMHDDSEIQGVADFLKDGATPADDPAMQFLWYDRSVGSKSYKRMPTFHHFDDHDVVAWRSSWNDDATCYLFRAGPPQGHAAAAKLKMLDDWTMNSGHVHPDIGMFWIYSGGEYLATDTGYTAGKRTDDHNTLLVDEYGQGMDGSYWVFRGLPYDKFDKVKIDRISLTKDYGYVSSDIASAYHPEEKLQLTEMRRHVIMTKKYIVTYDDIKSQLDHVYTWLLHTDDTIEQAGKAYTSKKGDMRLVTYAVELGDAQPLTATVEPTIVFAGRSPVQGQDQQRGYQLALRTDKRKDADIVTTMFSLGKDEKQPQSVDLVTLSEERLQLRIVWGPYHVEIVTLDLTWRNGSEGEPLSFEKVKQ